MDEKYKNRTLKEYEHSKARKVIGGRGKSKKIKRVGVRQKRKWGWRKGNNIEENKRETKIKKKCKNYMLKENKTKIV